MLYSARCVIIIRELKSVLWSIAGNFTSVEKCGAQGALDVEKNERN